ncbi:hypothetical protein DKT77_02485 [Meridianimarinicoccus roseus]|uniref:DUF3307 domain-containing protein n=1 Tax=Meridianimarinicoccus roseus TaxID=2072018 RepID=A0A2V2LRU1_9RHOB|nr:DUF3307 domain-containing protein [Meridianimarinicoccus roseus]PWR04183.1 hypothetical protein DKT77_02485 [Meridianimarinicoccus roseus]
MPAIETFSALAIAHIASDFLLQTRWIALNKRALMPMAVHIGIVGLTSWAALGFAAPLAVLALALSHLAMDVSKTRKMAKTGFSYGLDQGVHFATILAVALLVPDAWHRGIWAGSATGLGHWLLAFGIFAMGAVYATRGGLFFVDHLVAPRPCPACAWRDLDGRAHHAAIVERAVIFGGLVVAPVLAGLLCVARLAMIMRSARPAPDLAGALGSFLWAVMAGLGTQFILRTLTALDAAQAGYYP